MASDGCEICGDKRQWSSRLCPAHHEAWVGRGRSLRAGMSLKQAQMLVMSWEQFVADEKAKVSNGK